MFSLFRNYFSDKNLDLRFSVCGNYHTYIAVALHYRHVVRTNTIIMYYIIKFYIDIFYWNI